MFLSQMYANTYYYRRDIGKQLHLAYERIIDIQQVAKR